MKKYLLAAVACLVMTAPASAFDEKSAGSMLSFIPYAPLLCNTSNADVERLKRGIEALIAYENLDMKKVMDARISGATAVAQYMSLPIETARLVVQSQGVCDALDGAAEAIKNAGF